MDQQEGIPEFKVIVESDEVVSVQLTHLPDLGDIKKEEVNLDDLKRHTINALIGMLRDNRLKHQKEFEVLGSLLFSTLFYNKEGQLNSIGAGLHSAHDSSRKSKLLRVQLVFESNRKTPSLLAKWPWEYLYSPPQSSPNRPGIFLSKLTRLVLVRYLRMANPIPKLQVDSPPVKVLFIAASPRDLPRVQYESVLDELHDLEQRSGGNLKVATLLGTYSEADNDPDVQYATFDNFVALLTSFEPHVIHFVGHGRVSGDKGQIAFMHEDGTPHWIDDEDFANNVWDLSLDYLRLVFLQACETAQLPNPYEAISGVAQQLAALNIPAVVAMQYEIENQIANTFARAFYDALANAKYIDEAVQVGRQKVSSVGRTTSNVTYAFALPVLYMRQSGGLLPRTPSSPSPNLPGNAPLLASVSPAGRPCAYCQTPAWSGAAKICGNCGAELLCPNCNVSVSVQLKFCEQCGQQLKGSRDNLAGEVGKKTFLTG